MEYTNEPQEDELQDVTRQREIRHRTKWKMHQNAVHWINFVPADCLEKVVQYLKMKKFLHQQIHLSPRLPGRIILKKNTWKIQHKDQIQHESNTGETGCRRDDDRTSDRFQSSAFSTSRS